MAFCWHSTGALVATPRTKQKGIGHGHGSKLSFCAEASAGGHARHLDSHPFAPTLERVCGATPPNPKNSNLGQLVVLRAGHAQIFHFHTLAMPSCFRFPMAPSVLLTVGSSFNTWCTVVLIRLPHATCQRVCRIASRCGMKRSRGGIDMLARKGGRRLAGFRDNICPFVVKRFQLLFSRWQQAVGPRNVGYVWIASAYLGAGWVRQTAKDLEAMRLSECGLRWLGTQCAQVPTARHGLIWGGSMEDCAAMLRFSLATIVGRSQSRSVGEV